MTTSADIRLCNEALRLLGEFGIVSFEEGTDQAQTVGAIYSSKLTYLLTLHPWRFTLTKQRLARLTDVPDSEWLYMHALPVPMLALRSLFPTNAAGASPVKQYEIYGNRVLSNLQDLWADYQVATDPDTWPPYFRQLALAALAADFSMAVGAGMSAADVFHRRAFGSPAEMMNGGLLGAARRLDSMQQPGSGIRDFPLVTARFGRG